MNRREQLQERYEDALFALLMDEIATMEGKQAQEENERLKNDPSAAIPEDVDKRCLQTIRHHFAKQKAYSAGRFTVKTMKRAVMAAGIAAILFTGAFAASEDVRANTMNLIVEVFETGTVFRFEGRSDDVTTQVNVGWVPDGYTLEDHGSDPFGEWCWYRKSDTEVFNIDYGATTGSGINIDTEDAEIEYIEIQGCQAMLIKKESESNELSIAWITEDNSAFVTIYGESVDREDLIHVANSLIY